MAGGYQSQIGQQSTPLSGASAEDAGAAAARGLEEAGATIDRAIHQRREQNRDMEAAAAGLDLASASTELDKAAIDARANAAPGGEGHTDTIVKAIAERQSEALGKIRDPHIRAAFEQRWAQLRDNIETREYGWQAGARVDKLTSDVDSTGTTLANGMASNPNGAGLDLSLSTIETSINAMAIPADLKVKLIKEQQRKIAAAYGNAIVDKNPTLLVGDGKTKGLLEDGALSHYLEPDDIDRLRAGANVEIRRKEAEQRQQLTQQKADWLENVSVMRKRVTELGDYNVTDAELDEIGKGAATYGDKSVALEVGQWRSFRDVSKETRGWNPNTWSSSINALEAKQAKGTITPAETLRLATLNKLRPAAVERFNSDPDGAAAAAGNPAPPIDDWNDHAQVQARVTWARAFAANAGLRDIPYLNGEQLKDLRDRAGRGVAGKLEVAAELRNTFGGAIASDIARQVDKGDKDLGLMVGLHPRIGQLYSRGVEALQRNPKLAGADADDTEALNQAFNEFAPAIPIDLRSSVLNAARNIMAGTAAEHGHTELTGDNLTGAFVQSLMYAGGRLGGGSTSKGGFAKWNGQYTWLPQSMNEQDFQRSISRAGKADWIRAGGGEPYYLGSNGKRTKLNDTQISQLGRYRLETVSPGRYRLQGADGHNLVNKDGSAFEINVERLSR